MINRLLVISANSDRTILGLVILLKELVQKEKLNSDLRKEDVSYSN